MSWRGELGYLPLALAQAAAVIAAQRLDYRMYLDRLRSVPVQEYLTPAEGDPYPHGVAEAVLLSLDLPQPVTGRACAASSSMWCPCCRPQEFRGRFCTLPVWQVSSPTWAERKAQLAPHKIDEALGQLAGASLLTFSVDGFTVSAHRLIMRVARERRAHDGTLAALGSSICSLLSASHTVAGPTLAEQARGPGHHPASDRIE